ncbi:MAG: transposase, partial [Methylococcales bacterium]|nr:transposase [Methylococcales bacterium]
RGGPPEQPVVMFHYSPTRSQTVADELLQGFSGTVQTDGYAGYGNSAADCASTSISECIPIRSNAKTLGAVSSLNWANLSRLTMPCLVN